MIALRSLLTSLYACCACAVVSHGANASPLTLGPDTPDCPGSLSCTVPVEAIGKLTLRKGLVSIQGNRVQVQSSADDYLAPNQALTGFLVKVEAETEAIPPHITGLVYFQAGESLKEIDDPAAPDLIFKHDGATSGRIMSVDGGEMQVALANGSSLKLSLSTIKFVRSPRAFLFTIPVSQAHRRQGSAQPGFEAASITFKATTAPRALPASSILPEQPAGESILDNKLFPYGEGATTAGDKLNQPDLDEEDPITPVFKWSMPGVPGRRPFSNETNGAGGI